MGPTCMNVVERYYVDYLLNVAWPLSTLLMIRIIPASVVNVLGL